MLLLLIYRPHRRVRSDVLLVYGNGQLQILESLIKVAFVFANEAQSGESHAVTFVLLHGVREILQGAVQIPRFVFGRPPVCQRIGEFGPDFQRTGIIFDGFVVHTFSFVRYAPVIVGVFVSRVDLYSAREQSNRIVKLFLL